LVICLDFAAGWASSVAASVNAFHCSQINPTLQGTRVKFQTIKPEYAGSRSVSATLPFRSSDSILATDLLELQAQNFEETRINSVAPQNQANLLPNSIQQMPDSLARLA
jgi:hypothetical protein